MTERLSRRRQWHPTPVVLPGKSHGQRSLTGYSPWSHKESGTTQQLINNTTTTAALSVQSDIMRPRASTGEGTPLQYSCLGIPMDGGAWWAAVHGVAKSRTRLSYFTFTFHFHAWRRKWQPTPVFLPGEYQAQKSLVGCGLWGRTESETTDAT